MTKHNTLGLAGGAGGEQYVYQTVIRDRTVGIVIRVALGQDKHRTGEAVLHQYLRDRIAALQKIKERQKVFATSVKEQDVIAGLHRAVNPDNIYLESDLALVAIVGRGMKNAQGRIADRVIGKYK